MSFTQFVEDHFYASDTCVVPSLHKNQSDWLIDESGKVAVDYVGKIEELGKVVDAVREGTNGMLKIGSQVVNANTRSPSKNYRDLYSSYTRDLIAKRFEKDVDLFEYQF